jgi:hypothetical protein
MEERGFPDSGGPDNGKAFTCVHLEINPSQHFNGFTMVLEALIDIF